jgi:hypothetical protein
MEDSRILEKLSILIDEEDKECDRVVAVPGQELPQKDLGGDGMRLWRLMMGILIIGLIAPVYGSITGVVAPLFSDSVTTMLVYAGLALILFIFVYLELFRA